MLRLLLVPLLLLALILPIGAPAAYDCPTERAVHAHPCCDEAGKPPVADDCCRQGLPAPPDRAPAPPGPPPAVPRASHEVPNPFAAASTPVHMAAIRPLRGPPAIGPPSDPPPLRTRDLWLRVRSLRR